jgi:lipoprotein-releasing system permease protein
MMVTTGDRTATGVLLKGVDPARVNDVLDLPKHIVKGNRNLEGLRLPGSRPPLSRRESPSRPTFPSDADLKIYGDPPDKSGAIPDDEKDPFDQVEDLVEDEDAPEDLEIDPDKGITDLLADIEPEPEKSSEDDGDLLGAGGAAGLDLPDDAPVGSIVPEGGYDSKLPDDDFLPEEVNTDPCVRGGVGLPGIVIGKTLGEDLRAKMGDCVQVTSPTIGFSFSRDAIRAPIAKQFRVTGIFYAGFDQYDSKLVYTDLYEAQQFADAGDSVTGLEMRVSDIDNAREIARFIDTKLENGLHYTMDWEELNHGLFTALRIQQILMSAVLALIIVVAAFTVIATLIMVVLDKKKEIAVLKAMGANDGAILRTFLYQGMIIGAVGGIVGLGLAVFVCKLLLVYAIPLDPKVYFISRLPVDVQPWDFVLVGIFAVVVCLLATVWPAFHAARMRPVEAFREQ